MLLVWGDVAYSAAEATPSQPVTVKPTRDEVELLFKQREFELKKSDHTLAILASIGTGTALIFGLWQYFRAEQWKRAEFLAKEMKEFFGDPIVQNVLTMIDWSPRPVNLFLNPTLERDKFPVVTRELQVKALLPHTFLTKNVQPGSDANESASDAAIETVDWRLKEKYSSNEARIRDSYDRFLDGLGRFGMYIESDLLTRKAMDPYLRYWIDDVADDPENPDDAAWTCALLAYIQFYKFEGVQYLFKKYGYDIAVSEQLFKKQAEKMIDKDLAERLKECAQKEGSALRSVGG